MPPSDSQEQVGANWSITQRKLGLFQSQEWQHAQTDVALFARSWPAIPQLGQKT